MLESVSSAREGGASLTILSGFVAGNFSAYWLGITIMALMSIAYAVSTLGLATLMLAPAEQVKAIHDDYLPDLEPLLDSGLVGWHLLGLSRGGESCCASTLLLLVGFAQPGRQSIHIE